jgi:hypothetical protein
MTVLQDPELEQLLSNNIRQFREGSLEMSYCPADRTSLSAAVRRRTA